MRQQHGRPMIASSTRLEVRVESHQESSVSFIFLFTNSQMTAGAVFVDPHHYTSHHRPESTDAVLSEITSLRVHVIVCMHILTPFSMREKSCVDKVASNCFTLKYVNILFYKGNNNTSLSVSIESGRSNHFKLAFIPKSKHGAPVSFPLKPTQTKCSLVSSAKERSNAGVCPT